MEEVEFIIARYRGVDLRCLTKLLSGPKPELTQALWRVARVGSRIF